jgi:hypothetical protein
MGSTSPRKVISPVMATVERTGMRVSAETRAVHMPMPALGPSLGVAPSGTWMCTSSLLVEIRIDAEHSGPAAHHGHGGLDGLLHDLAQLARVGQLALAGHQRGLDAQQLAAHFGPGQSRDLAHLIPLVGAAVAETPDPQVFLQGLGVDHSFLAWLEQRSP